MNRWSRGIPLGFAFFLALQGSARTTRQVQTSIELDPAIECWFHDEFPQLDATFDPASDIARSRLYFRCTRYTDYYFVDLESMGAGYRGVAPKAQEDCPEVAYYVEVVRGDFTSDRTLERTAPVTSHTECRRRYPGVAFFTGTPSLRVGTTAQTLSNLVGFKMDGVGSLISAAGEVTAVGGGGLSGPTIAAIAGGAGGAVVIGAAAAGGGDSDGASGDGPGPISSASTTTTVPPTPPPGPQPVEACIEVEPLDATIRAGEQVRLDARCSTGENLRFDWNLGDGRTREGNFISPTYPNPGTFEITLTVTQVSTAVRSVTRLRLSGSALQEDVVDTASLRLTVLEGLTACFESADISPGFSCDTAYDASCSKGDIVRYEWLLDTTNVSGSGPVVGSGIRVTKDWFGTTACSFGGPVPIDVRLTVFDADGRSATIQRNTLVTYLTSLHHRQGAVSTSFSSYLGVPPFDGSASGQVSHNQQRVDIVNNQTPARHGIEGRLGTNSVEAYTTSPLSSPGYWRFDFRGAENFVARSIRVVSGQVLSQDDYTVVFRVSGEPGERIRFTYQLVP